MDVILELDKYVLTMARTIFPDQRHESSDLCPNHSEPVSKFSVQLGYISLLLLKVSTRPRTLPKAKYQNGGNMLLAQNNVQMCRFFERLELNLQKSCNGFN